VKQREENPIREESHKENEGLSVEPHGRLMLSQVVMTSMRIMRDFQWNPGSMKKWVLKMDLRLPKWKE